MLNNTKIMDYIRDFRTGELTNAMVFGDGGHGCYISRPIEEAGIVVSGPKRRTLFAEDPPWITFTNPFGDNMITGNVGLVECALGKFDI
jgi:uncharacterized protein (DUF1786 family)